MKSKILTTALVMMAGALVAGDTTPKDEVTSAAKKLGEKANYSWKTTVVVPEDAPFKPGPQEGQTEKDGVTHLKISFGDNTTEVFLKGEKAAVSNPDGGWQTLDELANSEGPGRFFATMFRNYRTPVVAATESADGTKELKKDGDAISGDLTEAGAKTLLTFRRRGPNDEGPTATNAKGSIKFWVKDGLLSKYEYKVTGKLDLNGDAIDVDRKVTVEIKDVGTTKIEIPEAAKKKFEPAAAPKKSEAK